MLGRARTEMVKEAEKVRAAAKTESIRMVAQRTAVFWAVALRLEKDKSAIPAALRAETDRMVRAIANVEAKPPIEIVKAYFDVTQTRPRGHYTRNKELERLFRAMSWLGTAAFAIEGKPMDVEGVALLERTWLGSKAGREGLERLMKVTTFFTGGPDSAGYRWTPRNPWNREAQMAKGEQLQGPWPKATAQNRHCLGWTASCRTLRLDRRRQRATN